MFAFILILMMIVIGSEKVSKPNEFNKNYISRDGTTPIKGIFVVLILLSHAKGYFSQDMSGFFDRAYNNVQNHLGQMIVAMFLFYSGYGIMEQLKKREFTYVKSIASKRFPNLLLNYDIAVVFYIILAFCLGTAPDIKTILTAFTAWNGIGNSSWFIFDTLVLYILTFISFFYIKWVKNQKLYIFGIIALTALSAVFMVFLLKTKTSAQSWWFNTVLLFVLGFWYSYFKEFIEKLVMKNDVSFLITAAVVTVAYMYTYLHRVDRMAMYFVYGAVFVLAVTVATMKIEINSKVLNWFGNHVFSVYILQRIPMMIMDKAGLSHSHRYVFTILAIVITCLMAEVYDRCFAWLTSKIWKPKKIKNG